MRKIVKRTIEEIHVNQCGVCPLFCEDIDDDGKRFWYCNLRDKNIDMNENTRFPDWCPLNNGGVLILRDDR